MRVNRTLSGFVATIILILAAIPPILAQVNPQPSPAMWVDPAFTDNLEFCDTFTVDIYLNVSAADMNPGATGLYAWEFKLYYENDKLNCTGFTDNLPYSNWNSPNSFLGGAGVENSYNGTHGRVFRAISAIPAVAPYPTPFVGVMSICTLTFHVISQPPYTPYVGDLALIDTITGDDTGGGFAHTAYDGQYQILPLGLPLPELSVHPKNIINPNLTPCKNFTVDIEILDVVDIYAWEFKLYYRNDILNATGVAEGSFLNSSGSTIFTVNQLTDTFNSTHGLVWVNCTLVAPPPVSGSGTLATISFHVEALGDTILDLTDTTLKDQSDTPIPHNVVDGYFNNVLIAHLYVDPPSIINPTLRPPANFTVAIKVANVTDLYDYQFKLGYDTSVLNCLGVLIIPFENETNFITEIGVNDNAGLIWVNVTYYPPANPLTTTQPRTLAIIFFQVEGLGTTVLDLHDTRLSDPLDGDIAHYVSDGLVSIVERDVAVIDVKLSTNMTYPGRNVYINVTVANEGDLYESFNVSTYFDDTLIGKLLVVDLAPDTNTTLAFTWDTTGTTPCHSYTIKAEASLVPYEMDTADNLYVDGTVKINMIGDLNGDGVINILDILIAATAFGSEPGDPNWDPRADISEPWNVINILDIVKIAVHFGETC